MPELSIDFETDGIVNLPRSGVHRYAADPGTGIVCVAFAVDDGAIETWIPGAPCPEMIARAVSEGWTLHAFNANFERLIWHRVLTPRYAWPEPRLEQWRCTQAAAQANALPASLEGAATALRLPFHKDPDGRAAMLRLARQSGRDGDLELALHYNRGDVEQERAVRHLVLPLSPEEAAVWRLDAEINDRGFAVDVELAAAAREIVRQEADANDVEIFDLTGGEITSANQVAKIAAYVCARGHQLKTLQKRSVSTVLARNPDADVKRLLELRRDGARPSVSKIAALFAHAGADDRIRGALKYHAASTGRWSGSGFQPQNLKRVETADFDADAAIAAVLTRDRDRVRAFGSPLVIVGDVMRGMICAPPGHVLIAGDFSTIEARILAWLAGEEWKLETFRQFDRTGDPALDPYLIAAARILKRSVAPDDDAGRHFGKMNELAFGFGGSLGAWRKFDDSENHTDAAVERFKQEWRAAHPATTRFWRRLESGIKKALRTGQGGTLGTLAFELEGGTLYLTLPSGRRLAYPGARLVPGKFDGTTAVAFHDNARGGWTEKAEWYGTFVENVVQATARDLLAAAMLRVEAAGYPIVLHVHDEIVCEVPEGSGSVEEFHRLMVEAPSWAAGLPIAAKVRIGKRYSKSRPAARPIEEAIKPTIAIPIIVDTVAPPAEAEEQPIEQEPESLPSLADLIGEPLVDGKICCPFHSDRTPSLQIYDDHFHCFGCGAHGDRIDWLMTVDGLTRDQALETLQNWKGRADTKPRLDDGKGKRARALRLWRAAQPIAGTLAAQYLAEHRRIDLAALPPNIDDALRFHPHCPFGPGVRHPCLLALMRNVTSDEPTGVHRVALAPDGNRIERRMLGSWGAVKLWPANGHLVVGEGIETVLAAATRLSHKSEALRPAWSAISSTGLGKLPVVAGVERLIVLVDHDRNGVGQTEAARLAERWSRAGRHVTQLKPKRPGTDFNDVVMSWILMKKPRSAW